MKNFLGDTYSFNKR